MGRSHRLHRAAQGSAAQMEFKLASAQDYINNTTFSTFVGGPDNNEYAVISFDGKERIFYIDGDHDDRLSDVIEYRVNMAGPIPDLLGGGFLDVGYLTRGFSGNDTIAGHTLNDWLTGGAGADVLKGMDGDDMLHGEGSYDWLSGGNGNDALYGGVWNDTLNGDEGNDWLHGGDDADMLYGGTGADTMTGGSGNDFYDVDSVGDVVVEGANGGIDFVLVDLASYTLGANIENARADYYEITLTGNGLDNNLGGGYRADTIKGMSGADKVTGGSGNDQIYGGTENDTIEGEDGDDRIVGDLGNDNLYGGFGADTLEGGTGDDTYSVGNYWNMGDDAIDVLIEGLNGGTDTVISRLAVTTLGANFENLTLLFGTTGNGNELNNSIIGSASNDTINGMAGNDSIRAGDGVDLAYGGLGIDTVLGGNGNDYLFGGLDADFVYGGADNDFLYGDAANDKIWGDTGNDLAYGGDGNDDLRGGDGVDQLRGGNGADLLYGDAGADRFIFSSAAESKGGGFDRIMDFNARAGDMIDLSAIDADTTLAGNQAFNFAGSKTMFSGAGDLFASGNLLGTYVEGDLNGDGFMDFAFLISGVYAVTESYFIL